VHLSSVPALIRVVLFVKRRVRGCGHDYYDELISTHLCYPCNVFPTVPMMELSMKKYSENFKIPALHDSPFHVRGGSLLCMAGISPPVLLLM
jgi:hypothetical protein